MENFNILYGKSVFIITAIVVLILISVLIFIFFLLAKQKSNVSKYIRLGTIVFILLPLIIASFFIPTSYNVSDTEIVINKVVGKISIDKNEVKEISIIHSNDLNGMYRKFASGGFGGYYGKYSSPKHGIIYIYAGTLSHNLVMIELNNNISYIVTPKNITEFIATTPASQR